MVSPLAHWRCAVVSSTMHTGPGAHTERRQPTLSWAFLQGEAGLSPPSQL